MTSESRRAGTVAVIGCGAVVQQVYVETLPRLPSIRVEYVCDLNQAAARAVAERLGSKVGDIDTICRTVETVIIATPPSTHYQLVKTCLDAGVNVVCEKPFVTAVADAQELVALAQSRGLRLQVAHFRRMFPSVLLARGLIAGGALGAVQAIRVAEGGRFTWQTASGYVSNDPWGGVLFDTGSHALDMALFCTGMDQAELYVEVNDVRRDRPEPAHEMDATFRTRAGATVVDWDLRLSRYQSLSNRVRIQMERGTIDVSVAPRDRIRLTGPTGTSILPVELHDSRLTEYFLRQWTAILVRKDGHDFDGARFVGLTAILAALGRGEAQQ